MTTLTHGHSRRCAWTPTYYTWASMVQRCKNPARNGFHLYGGRGITVCPQWMTFANFLSDMGERPLGMSIGRIDQNGNYEPDNCEWQTATKQARSRGNNKLTPEAANEIRAMYRSGSLSQRQLGDRFGVSKTMIRNVVSKGAWA